MKESESPEKGHVIVGLSMSENEQTMAQNEIVVSQGHFDWVTHSDNDTEVTGDKRSNREFDHIKQNTDNKIIEIANKECRETISNTKEGVDGLFNQICVKNMIQTCVDKLSIEYEHEACRKVISADPRLETSSIEENIDAIAKETEATIEVQFHSFSQLLNFRVSGV